ncbi:MAG: MFS transporter, partial [Ramlibacter sp.]|nr:MFS transporter [Ramlibacter sp.]
MTLLDRRSAIVTFLAFAFAYFFSALMRAITATLSPTLTQEFALSAQELGLLAGGFFLGFAATQLPLGTWLDRHGPKRVIVSFLAVAVIGSIAFSFANSFVGLLAARVLCGVGVSACLMAPLTGFRSWLEPATQLRANSWMLMTGSFGMVGSTLPVQWLMPLVGWRPLFWGLALAFVVSMVARAWLVRAKTGDAAAGSQPA